MIGRSLSLLFLALLWLGIAGGCAGPSGAEGERSGSGAAGGAEMAVRRGDLQERMLVTGELVAEQAAPLDVPRTRAFQLQIRWIAEDGTPIKAGQPVVEFDNSSFASDLEEKKLSVSEAVNELARMQAEGESNLSEKAFVVQEKRTALEKARTEAVVPRDLLTLREYQERQSALERAEVELAKAEKDLAAFRQTQAADLEVKRIDLERSRREIQEAERAIQVLAVRSPRDGLVLASEHPWEGRKFQEGDTVWPGMTVASIPDLSSLRVEAALPDVDDGRVRPGMRVVCYLDAYPSLAFPGRVVEIAPVARESAYNSLRRYFAMKVDLDRVDTGRMRPGMSVRVEVLGRGVKDALLVPRAALDLSGKSPRALLASGGATPVRLRLCTATTCAVEGLQVGTRLRSATSSNDAGAGRTG
ncbi:MAG TPA: efflux RND transporter periplasmic adaptor subunit [Thermoanaerobaculia bacterium]|nr:efflux RND transporter periplasmic adaptor subunit [Thermoanaerobaculia bacterium]